MHRIVLAWLCCLVFLAACTPAATPTPTPDAKATETHIAFNVIATLTASVPTATATRIPSQTPTLTLIPTVTHTPTVTRTPLPTSTPSATRTPTLRPTDLPTPTPVAQNQTVRLAGDYWEAALISVRRDKTIWGASGPETAFGVWATFLFRVRNLQSGSDYLGKLYNFVVTADGTTVRYRIMNTVETKAKWFYACCETAYALIGPGDERIVLISFDVPEASETLLFNFAAGDLKIGSSSVPVLLRPTFLVEHFDQVSPRPAK